MDKEKLFEFYSSNRGGIHGALIGLAMSVSILIIGLFDSLFVAICVGIGYYVGKRLFEDKNYIKSLLDKILSPGSYR